VRLTREFCLQGQIKEKLEFEGYQKLVPAGHHLCGRTPLPDSCDLLNRLVIICLGLQAGQLDNARANLLV